MSICEQSNDQPLDQVSLADYHAAHLGGKWAQKRASLLHGIVDGSNSRVHGRLYMEQRPAEAQERFERGCTLHHRIANVGKGTLEFHGSAHGNCLTPLLDDFLTKIKNHARRAAVAYLVLFTAAVPGAILCCRDYLNLDTNL